MQELRVPITFTVAELWLLNDLIRHEEEQQDNWKFPPASLDLNDEIANAIEICDHYSLSEYTLVLGRHDLLVIDYNIRKDYKTPEGAKGKVILLKSFRARRLLEDGPSVVGQTDLSYNEIALTKK